MYDRQAESLWSQMRREAVAKPLTDTLGGREITFTFDPDTDQLTLRDGAGSDIPFITAYWAVWKGMYPETGLYGKKR